MGRERNLLKNNVLMVSYTESDTIHLLIAVVQPAMIGKC